MHVGDGLLERVVACVAWTQPREMTPQDIQKAIRCFVDTARLMADAGFSGVELHGAHGYLIGMHSIRVGLVMPTADNNRRSILEQQGTHRTQSRVLPQTIDTDPERQTSAPTSTAAHPKNAPGSC